jgi:hypothetical protein
VPALLIGLRVVCHSDNGSDVSQCLSNIAVETVGKAAIDEFDQKVPRIPADRCGLFHEEARQLDTKVLTIYKIVAASARETEDLVSVAGWWNAMVHICDYSANRIKSLAGQHPGCGAEQYYDRIFDLRTRCRRLAGMHK